MQWHFIIIQCMGNYMGCRKEEGEYMEGMDDTQAGMLVEIGIVQEFVKLLVGNCPGREEDLSGMFSRMDEMERQLGEALRELAAAKQEIAGMQESPVQGYVERAFGRLEDGIHGIKERMAGIKERIVEKAKEAVEGFKRFGVEALDKAVSSLGIKDALERIQEDLKESISDLGKSIGKMEAVGQELRDAGGHIKNAGRAAAGKERREADGSREGLFQAAVLSPLRLERNILKKLSSLALAVAGHLERLEQAAGRAREETLPDAGRMPGRTGREEMRNAGSEGTFHGNRQPEKGKEKPSLLKELHEGRTQAASCPAHAPGRERMAREAAL